LDELYVTTGAYKIDDEDLPPPDNGALYRIRNVGAKGSIINTIFNIIKY
jgi:gluconolactonase